MTTPINVVAFTLIDGLSGGDQAVVLGFMLAFGGTAFLIAEAIAKTSNNLGLPLHGAVPTRPDETNREINERVAKADEKSLAGYRRRRPTAIAAIAIGLTVALIGALVLIGVF